MLGRADKGWCGVVAAPPPLVGRLAVHVLPRGVELRVHLVPMLFREHLRVLRGNIITKKKSDKVFDHRVRLIFSHVYMIQGYHSVRRNHHKKQKDINFPTTQ